MNHLKKDIVINLGFTLLKTFVLFYSIHLAESLLLPSALGLVLLFRRQSGVWASLLNFGQSQNILKYNQSVETEARYFSSLVISLYAIVIYLVFSIIFSSSGSLVLFDSEQPIIYQCFAVYVVGVICNFIACSSWLSEHKYILANLTELFSIGITFIVSLVIFPNDLIMILVVNALGAMIISLLSLTFYLFLYKHKVKEKFQQTWFNLSIIKTNLKFGLPRGFASFLDGSVFLVGPWLLASNKKEAGYLIIALTLLKAIQVLLMPISQVLALRVVKNSSQGNSEEIKLLKLLIASLVLSIVGVILYELVKTPLLQLWLPNSAQPVVYYLDQFIDFLPALVLFYLLRNYVDLKFTIPFNLIFFIILLSFFFISYYIQIAQGTHLNQVVISSLQYAFGLFFVYSVAFLFQLISICNGQNKT